MSITLMAEGSKKFAEPHKAVLALLNPCSSRSVSSLFRRKGFGAE